MHRYYSAESVFQPKSYPVHTYVDRTIGMSTYAKRMQRAIRTPGNLVVISGASKSGKTVLCHRVIPDEQIIDLSGSQIQENADFWEQIAENLEMPRTNIDMIKYVIQTGRVLVIDDFHYIPLDVQQYIARTLKTELFHGLKAVILTLPHRSDDAIRLNPDLIGRTTVIEIQPWSMAELEEIARKGFPLLSIDISADEISALARESIASPQLMQENCLSLAEEMLDASLQAVTQKLLLQAFSITAMNYEYYRTPLQEAEKGPAQGRKRRTKYLLCDGKQVDGYKLLLLALTKDPPQLSFAAEDIQQRIMMLLAKNQRQKLPILYISNIAKHIEKSLQKSLPQLDTLEWKDKTLYILDPFLLFYLRWNEEWKN